MERTIVRSKWFATASSAVAMAGLWFGVAIFRPSTGKAFTLIERSGFIFPEVTVQGSDKLMLCTNNLTGNGNTQVLIGLLDVADSTRFLAGTSPVSASLNAQQGGCSLLLPAVQTTAGILAPVRTGIPVVFIMGGGSNQSGGGGGAGKGLLSSLQLLSGDGSVRLITTPTLMDGLLLPAVQLP
jgi:hypothetical protein